MTLEEFRAIYQAASDHDVDVYGPNLGPYEDLVEAVRKFLANVETLISTADSLIENQRDTSHIASVYGVFSDEYYKAGIGMMKKFTALERNLDKLKGGK